MATLRGQAWKLLWVGVLLLTFGLQACVMTLILTCELVSGYHDQLGQGEDLHMNGASWKIGHRNTESPNVD